MKIGNMVFKKTCSIYASDLHFITMTLPYIHRELESGVHVLTMLEKDSSSNVKKLINNMNLNFETIEKLLNINWKRTKISEIKNIVKKLSDIINNEYSNIDILVSGNNRYINIVNEAIDIFIKNNLKIIESNNIGINVINCFEFSPTNNIDQILSSHEYILDTRGEKLIEENDVLYRKAN